MDPKIKQADNSSLSIIGYKIENHCISCRNPIDIPKSERCKTYNNYCQKCILKIYLPHTSMCEKCHLNMKYSNIVRCFRCLNDKKTFRIPCCEVHQYCEQCLKYNFDIVESLCKKCTEYFKNIDCKFRSTKCSICSENCKDSNESSRCHSYCKRCLDFSRTNHDNFFMFKAACMSCLQKYMLQLKSYEEVRKKEEESKALEENGIKKCWMCEIVIPNGIFYKTPRCINHNYCEECLIDFKTEVHCKECKQYFSSITREINHTNMMCVLCTIGGDFQSCNIHTFCRHCKDFMIQNDFSKYYIFRSCQQCTKKFQDLNQAYIANLNNQNSGRVKPPQQISNINYISQSVAYPQPQNANNAQFLWSEYHQTNPNNQPLVTDYYNSTPSYPISQQPDKIIYDKTLTLPNLHQSITINQSKQASIVNAPPIQSSQSISKKTLQDQSIIHPSNLEGPSILISIKNATTPTSLNAKNLELCEVQKHINADLQENIINGIQFPLCNYTTIEGFNISDTTICITPMCAVCNSPEIYSCFLCNHNYCYDCLIINAVLEIYNFFQNYQSNSLIIYKKFEHKCAKLSCRYNIKVPTLLVLSYLTKIKNGEMICKNRELFMKHKDQLELIAGMPPEWIPYFDGFKFNSVCRRN